MITKRLFPMYVTLLALVICVRPIMASSSKTRENDLVACRAILKPVPDVQLELEWDVVKDAFISAKKAVHDNSIRLTITKTYSQNKAEYPNVVRQLILARTLESHAWTLLAKREGHKYPGVIWNAGAKDPISKSIGRYDREIRESNYILVYYYERSWPSTSELIAESANGEAGTQTYYYLAALDRYHTDSLWKKMASEFDDMVMISKQLNSAVYKNGDLHQHLCYLRNRATPTAHDVEAWTKTASALRKAKSVNVLFHSASPLIRYEQAILQQYAVRRLEKWKLESSGFKMKELVDAARYKAQAAWKKKRNKEALKKILIKLHSLETPPVTMARIEHVMDQVGGPYGPLERFGNVPDYEQLKKVYPHSDTPEVINLWFHFYMSDMGPDWQTILRDANAIKNSGKDIRVLYIKAICYAHMPSHVDDLSDIAKNMKSIAPKSPYTNRVKRLVKIDNDQKNGHH